MKKVGIFGDSYTEVWPITSLRPGIRNNSWVLQLQQEYPAGECVTHGAGGSNLAWSFRQFLDHHGEYEKVIFVVTNLHRWSFPEGKGFKIRHRPSGTEIIYHHLPNVSHAEFLVKEWDCENNMAQKILDYMVWMSSPSEQFISDQHMATVHYIKTIRPDAIIIPGFDPKKTGCNDLGYDFCLCDIDNRETQKFFKERGKVDWNDPRPNHFSPRTTDWILKHIKGRLAGEFIQWRPGDTEEFNTLEDFNQANGITK